MKALLWFVIIACLAGIVFALWAIRRRELMRQRQSEARSAAMLSEAMQAMRARSRATGPAARD